MGSRSRLRLWSTSASLSKQAACHIQSIGLHQQVWTKEQVFSRCLVFARATQLPSTPDSSQCVTAVGRSGTAVVTKHAHFVRELQINISKRLVCHRAYARTPTCKRSAVEVNQEARLG